MTGRILIFLLVLGFTLPTSPGWSAAQQTGRETAVVPESRVAVLKGLDKVTARISTIEAPLNQWVRFGTLEIIVRTCSKRPPEEPPETSAFLEIDDVRRLSGRTRLFSGWMFASSPALSALEHPVYDVWVIDCRTSLPQDSGAKE